jgi:hypothetical protein
MSNNKRLLDYDPVTGTAQYHYYDHSTDTTTIERVENANPTLEFIQEIRKTSDDAWRDAVRKDDGSGTYAGTITPNMQITLMDYGLNLFSESNDERKAAVKKAQELWPEAFITKRKLYK